MDFLQKKFNSFINFEKIQSQANEVNYFLEDYKPKDKKQKDLIDNAR